MSPLHILVVLFAIFWQVANGGLLGSWLAAYGPVHESDWTPASNVRFVIGIVIWWAGLSSNFFHDEALRAIRNKEQKRLDTLARENGGKYDGTVKKHYEIPEAGLFKYALFAHYFCEWIEWFGFYMACGFGSVPARTFFLNEIFVMLPRALTGKKWYIEKFGADRIGKRKAVIPGLI